MAHKTGRKFKKLAFNKPGWGMADFGKSLNFGDVATIAGFAALPFAGASMMSQLGTSGAGGGLLSQLGNFATGGQGMSGLLGNLGKVGGLMSTMGGGGGAPQYDITGGSGSDLYKSMEGNIEKQQQLADDMMDVDSEYNIGKRNELKDLISFGNTMGARNMAKSGMNVSGSNILSENLEGNLNTALNRFNENIPKNANQVFNMYSGINQQQMPMYENLVNQDIANQNRSWQEGQNNQGGWLDLGLGLLDYYQGDKV